MAMVWASGGTLVILIAWGCMEAWLYGWRILLAICTLPLLIFLCLSPWMPESILYLVKKDKKEKAESILRIISQQNNKTAFIDTLKIKYDEESTKEDEDSVKGNVFKLCQKRFTDISMLFGGGGQTRLTLLIWAICVLAGFSYYGCQLFSTELVRYDNDKDDCTHDI